MKIFQEFQKYFGSWIMFLLLSLSLFFVRSQKFHFLHILLDIFVGLTPFHLNKKYRKWTDIFWGKNLHVFLQNSTFFTQILMIILKIDVTLKSFLAMQFFNYCLNQIFPCKFLLLNSSIWWQQMLFHLIKAWGKYKQVIKSR